MPATAPSPARAALPAGVHAHGGPSTTDQPKDLSGLCNRSPADARGISKAKHH